MIGEHTKGGLAAAFIYGESDYLTIERIERDGKACAAIRGTEKAIIDAQSAMELYKRDRADALSLCIYHSVRTPSMMMAPARAASARAATPQLVTISSPNRFSLE